MDLRKPTSPPIKPHTQPARASEASPRHPPACTHHQHPSTVNFFSRAFTFIEVLFAIIILGIGLIMIAAMLPVAIKNNEDTLRETAGRAVAEAGFNYIRAVASDANLPATVNVVQTITGTQPPLFEDDNAAGGIRGNIISSADRRFAFIPFYQRPSAGPGSATIWVIGVQLRNRDNVPNGVYPANTFAAATNGPFAVPVSFTNNRPPVPDLITFQSASDFTLAAPGAFIITRDTGLDPDNTPGNAAPRYGRVFRLGVRDDSQANTYRLDPAWDIPELKGADLVFNTGDDDLDTSLTGSQTVFIIGAGRLDPTSGSSDFAGPAQDVVIVGGRIPLP